MKYTGIVVGALISIIGTVVLTLVFGAAMSASSTTPADVEGDFGVGLGAAVLSATARVLGGATAGLMARRTRSMAWTVGAGSAAGLLAFLVMFLLGVLANTAAGETLASAEDIAAFFLWTLEGALGGWLAWLLRGRR